MVARQMRIWRRQGRRGWLVDRGKGKKVVEAEKERRQAWLTGGWESTVCCGASFLGQ